MDMTGLFIGLGVAVVVIILLVVMLTTMYVKAPPSTAFILSGFRKEPRILVGNGGFKIPIIERLDTVFLGQVTVDVKTNRSVPTHDYINVNVDAVCKVRVAPTPEGTRLAAKNFLNMNPSQIAAQITDSLEGNMREVVGALTLEGINTNRDAFSDQIQSKAAPDMGKLGLEIISCNIQNITDDNGLIKDMGADNTYAIKKNAAITKANAEKEIAIAEQNAKKEANDVRVKTETEIAERNNELQIRKATLKKEADTMQADADAAYEIQKQEQQKTINVKTVEAEATKSSLTQERLREINVKTMEAEIAKAEGEAKLKEQQVQIQERALKAEINAKADADKYQTEKNAEAMLEKQKRDAEAKAYVAEQEAKAVKAKADAQKYAALQEAAGIEAKGKAEALAKQATLEAEAEGIRAKGLAEAEAMEKKAEAYERYGNVAIIDMLAKMTENTLPQVAANIAKPMESIDSVNIYGSTGNECAGIAQNVPTLIKQTFDTVESVTGVNMADVMRSHTINAKTDKNINIDGLNIPEVLTEKKSKH